MGHRQKGKDSILVRFVINIDDLRRFSGPIREPIWPVRYFVEGAWLGEVASRFVVLVREEINLVARV